MRACGPSGRWPVRERLGCLLEVGSLYAVNGYRTRGRTPVDLFEHQAKELFAQYGVPVPSGRVAVTPQEDRVIAEEFAAAGVSRVVVKAQVKTGGRGKAGGVKLADSPADAEEKAGQIL